MGMNLGGITVETMNKEAALHSIVKESIIDLIKNGEYQTNTKLPTEAEFCKIYGVSRTTVRTALQQLNVEGYIYRVQGKGTFVSENKVKQFLTSTVEKFSEQVTMQGKNPSTKVISLKVIEANATLAKLFKQNIGDPVNKLERIRYVNDIPFNMKSPFSLGIKHLGLISKPVKNHSLMYLKHNSI